MSETLLYFLIPLAVLVLGLAWKLHRAQQGGDAPAAGTTAWGSTAGRTGAVPQSAEGIRQLLARNDKLGAVKLYRTLYGGGLKEARDAVESLQAGGSLPLLPASAAPQAVRSAAAAGEDAEIRRLVADNQLIAAIKRYRDLTGAGLKEAKDAVERLRDGQ